MKIRVNMFAIILATASLALAPSLLNIESANAAYYCSDEKGKSKAWIEGCKQGWYDHNHCLAYNPGTGEVAKGYKVGWSKGSC
ncbi:MAG: hypothetical protein P0116_15420 [Candidatus Nitrosocosmicus sp.]|nr:hypothetical protein [Candidatus Nitrosocosmicus sp.]